MINSRDGKFNCADCMLAFDFEITVKPRKTYDEVTVEFDKIPLTKNQRTGSGNKPYKRKKKS